MTQDTIIFNSKITVEIINKINKECVLIEQSDYKLHTILIDKYEDIEFLIKELHKAKKILKKK